MKHNIIEEIIDELVADGYDREKIIKALKELK